MPGVMLTHGLPAMEYCGRPLMSLIGQIDTNLAATRESYGKGHKLTDGHCGRRLVLTKLLPSQLKAIPLPPASLRPARQAGHGQKGEFLVEA
jgi:hypothetical protein